MTVLITGGTGNLGSVLRRLMQADGSEVRVLSRRERPPGETSATWATGDLKTGAGLQEAVAGITTVIHCATDGRTDVASTERLVAAARRAGVQHLLYISTSPTPSSPGSAGCRCCSHRQSRSRPSRWRVFPSDSRNSPRSHRLKHPIS